MADGTNTETIKPTPEPAKPLFRGEKFANWLKGLRRGHAKQEPQSKSFNPEQYSEFIDVLPEKKFTLSTFLADTIRKKGLKAPEFKSRGATGTILATNEKANPELLLKLKHQKQAPDGYLIAVGGGNWASLLDTFPEDKPPKGIILANIDPDSVKQLQELVDALKGNRELTRAISDYLHYSNYSEEEYYTHIYSQGRENVFTPAVIAKHLPLLQRLAREGNIAVVQQDFLDPQLLEVFSNLPRFKDSNNVIYLSNISDWVYRGAEDKIRDKMIATGEYTDETVDTEEINALFSRLHQLDSGEGHRNYFADSTEKSLRYKLRIGTQIPVFDESDFSSYTTRLALKLPDQLGDTSNLTAEGEYRKMGDVEVLKEFYKLKEDPNYKRAVKEQVERINKYRASLGSDQAVDFDKDLILGLAYELRLLEINESAKETGHNLTIESLKLPPVSENSWRYWVTSQEIIKMAQIYNRLFSETRGGVPPGSTADYLAELIMNTYRIDPAEVKPSF